MVVCQCQWLLSSHFIKKKKYFLFLNYCLVFVSLLIIIITVSSSFFHYFSLVLFFLKKYKSLIVSYINNKSGKKFLLFSLDFGLMMTTFIRFSSHFFFHIINFFKKTKWNEKGTNKTRQNVTDPLLPFKSN